MQRQKSLFEILHYPLMAFCVLAPLAFVVSLFYVFTKDWNHTIRFSLILSVLVGGYFWMESANRNRYILITALVFTITVI